MSALNHLHIYERSSVNKQIYRCIDPYCTHFCNKALLLGKAAKCFKCGREFLLDAYDLKLKRPLCPNCGTDSISLEGKKVKEFLKEMMKDEISI